VALHEKSSTKECTVSKDSEEEKTTFQVLFGNSNPASITVALLFMSWYFYAYELDGIIAAWNK